MKCIICPVEINEAQEFPPIDGPSGRPIEDLTGRLKLARELEKWTFISLTAQVPGGCKTIRSGHLCPAHGVDDLTFALVPKGSTTQTETAAPAKVEPPKSESKGKSS